MVRIYLIIHRHGIAVFCLVTVILYFDMGHVMCLTVVLRVGSLAHKFAPNASKVTPKNLNKLSTKKSQKQRHKTQTG